MYKEDKDLLAKLPKLPKGYKFVKATATGIPFIVRPDEDEDFYDISYPVYEESSGWYKWRFKEISYEEWLSLSVQAHLDGKLPLKEGVSQWTLITTLTV